MARAAVVALLFLVVMAGDAQATAFRVVAVPGLELEALRAWEDEAALGLLVPTAGPETSERLALAGLVRGAMPNSVRGGAPGGKRLIEVEMGRALVPGRPTILVGVPSGGPQRNDRRYPIAVFGRGYRGVLVSDSTRIPGLVSVADVAPTALGGPQPLSWREQEDAAEELLRLDERIAANNDGRLAATLVVAALALLLALVFPRAALLGIAAALAANVVLGLAGVSSSWAVYAIFAVAVVAAGPLLALVLRTSTAIGLGLAGVVALYLGALAADGPAVALSPLGPTQNSRFFGISNLLETLLLVPALAGAALLAVPFGVLGFVSIAALSLLAVSGNRFGADGGGAIVLAVGFVVLATLLADDRRRATLVSLLAAVGGVSLLIALDRAAGGSSHVTRAVEGGPDGLARDLADRVLISYERLVAHWWVALLVAAGSIALAGLVIHLLRRDIPLGRRALPIAFAAAIATSLVVNDSPNDVVLVGLVGFLVVERGILRDRCGASLSSSPWSFSWPGAAAARPWRPRPRP